MAHGEWLVRLGESEWARLTYTRPDGHPLRLLGAARLRVGKGADIEGTCQEAGAPTRCGRQAPPEVVEVLGTMPAELQDLFPPMDKPNGTV